MFMPRASWRAYGGFTPPTTHAIDSLTFRASSSASGTSGNGLFIDDVEVSNANNLVPTPTAAGGGIALLALLGLVGMRRRHRKAEA